MRDPQPQPERAVMSPTTAGTPATPAGHQFAPAAVRAVICYTRTANPGSVGQRHLQRQRAKLHEDLHQSGTTLARPGLHRALTLLAGRQADALLATDPTRLAVAPAVTSQLAALANQHDWQLLTVTPTPTSTTAPAATVVDRGLSRGGAR
jgi:hypothetical protein